MAQGDRNYAYFIFDQNSEVFGTDDDTTAEKASEDDECIVIAAKSGLVLHTGRVVPEYPIYEEPEDESDDDDI